jgi:tetratricopeptide (TPR) repeat protein
MPSTSMMYRPIITIALLLAVSGATAQTRQQWRDSLEVLSQQICRQPSNISLRLKKAEANINLEQWDYAIAEYGDILRLDPKNLAALYFRAFVHYNQHHYDLARVDYETFLSISPDHFEARLGLAHVIEKMGRKAETADALNRLVQQFPDSATAYAARAAYEVEQKQYEVALYDWDEAIRLRPEDTGFMVSKVDVLLQLGRKKEALQVLRDAVRRGVPSSALKEWFDKCR